MRRLKFLRQYSLYNAGEVAGFAPAIAAQIVDSGAARYDDVPAAAAAENVQAPAPQEGQPSGADLDATAAEQANAAATAGAESGEEKPSKKGRGAR